MKSIKVWIKVSGIFGLLFFTSCSIAPLLLHETSRTVETDHFEATAGHSNVGYVVKLRYGVFEHFDIGIQVGADSESARVKYAFVENPLFAASAALGFATSFLGLASYGDLSTSIRIAFWEPYLTWRLAYLLSGSRTTLDHSLGNLKFRTSHVFSNVFQTQIFLGSRFYIGPRFFISTEVAGLWSPIIVSPVGIISVAGGVTF